MHRTLTRGLLAAGTAAAAAAVVLAADGSEQVDTQAACDIWCVIDQSSLPPERSTPAYITFE